MSENDSVKPVLSSAVPMTIEGKRMLEDELKRLRSVERPSVIKAIEEARALGDLSENAEYSAAKERQSFIEGRIQELNAKLASAQVIDPTTISTDKVVFGATVVLSDQDSGKEVTYKIVGTDESDIKQNKLSVSAPLARALIGKKVGDEVTVNAPKGSLLYDVVEIRYE
ncbi:MAG TPA: transcription elongation factor GreA [Oligoflexia bacterium]|nr:transcription elongation factor GreA [Oligoflexia bacterium]